MSVVKRGEFSEFGINSWNDLLKQLFNRVNHTQQKYRDFTGLNLAISEINNSYDLNGKIPTSRTKGMRSIVFSAQNKYWTDYGINSWNELLIHIFGFDAIMKRIKQRR